MFICIIYNTFYANIALLMQSFMTPKIFWFFYDDYSTKAKEPPKSISFDKYQCKKKQNGHGCT